MKQGTEGKKRAEGTGAPPTATIMQGAHLSPTALARKAAACRVKVGRALLAIAREEGICRCPQRDTPSVSLESETGTTAHDVQ